MIEPFQFYLDQNLVRKGISNISEAESLMKKANDRAKYVERQKNDEFTASFIFEDIYESLREAAQALMELKGYKPYSHEAIIAFLKEFYNFPESEISLFNRYRILRNNCFYRAARVSAITCNEALEFLKKFLPKLKQHFDKEVKR